MDEKECVRRISFRLSLGKKLLVFLLISWEMECYRFFFVSLKSREIKVLSIVFLLHGDGGLPCIFFCDRIIVLQRHHVPYVIFALLNQE